jgi:beta-glucosidase
MAYAPGYLSDNSTNDSLIQSATIAAKTADVIVVNIGISGKMAGEDRALAYPQISAGQLSLLKA